MKAMRQETVSVTLRGTYVPNAQEWVTQVSQQLREAAGSRRTTYTPLRGL